MYIEKCPHCNSSEDEVGFIFSNKYWRAFVADEQSYLGRCIVELKEHKNSLSDLSSEEWLSLSEIISMVELAIRKTFNADLFNWTCMMNNAYQESDPIPHVHWHVRPRYSKKVEFGGKVYSDPEFGQHYNRDRKEKASGETLNLIAKKLLESKHK